MALSVGHFFVGHYYAVILEMRLLLGKSYTLQYRGKTHRGKHEVLLYGRRGALNVSL